MNNLPHSLASGPTMPGRWTPALSSDLCLQSCEVIQKIAGYLSDVERILSYVEKQESQRSTSLASGFSGLAVLFHTLACCSSGKNLETALTYISLAAQATHQHPFTHPGLFNGTAGLAFAVSLLTNDDERYLKIYEMLNEQLAAQVLQMEWYREKDAGVADQDYDVVTGASGILAYLITIDTPSEPVILAIQLLLTYLIWLAGADRRVRWYIPPELSPEEEREMYPVGYFNCGLAHGIPGPLAALALAWRAGYRISGQHEAISTLAHWLIEHHVIDQWGLYWPFGIPLERSSQVEDWRSLPATLAGWCYGSPGVARSLWHAGGVLEDTSMQQTALNALEAVLTRPTAQWGLTSPMLCHGLGGLLLICLHFAHETDCEGIRRHIPALVTTILHDPKLTAQMQNANSSIDPTLLTGLAGTALALLAASTDSTPVWDRMLLLS